MRSNTRDDDGAGSVAVSAGSGAHRFEPRWCRGEETTPRGGKLVAWLGRLPLQIFCSENLGVREADHLLDDLIRPPQHRRRDRQAERLGGLEVDDQLELGGLLDRKVTGL